MTTDPFDEPELDRAVIAWIADRCGLPAGAVDPDRPMVQFGLSSVDAVELAGRLEERLGRPLDPVLAWRYPSVNALVAGLTDGTAPAADHRPAAALSGGEPVAVVGMACRFPGGDGLADWWTGLLAGRRAIGTVPAGRWSSMPAGPVLDAVPRHGGFLPDIAGFDADFFGLTADEARLMDPQQRLLLEVTHEALQHAALAPESLRGSETGVYVGLSGNEYGYLAGTDLGRVEPWTATGGASSIAANRLSYHLDLRGPSLVVDTACSSSLVAVHLAVRDLRAGDTGLAVAAGVNLLLTPAITRAFDRGGALSPTGVCRPFGAGADGTVRAEGCGVVLLKRLADARRDGDRVLAVIRGSAVNSDGRSNGLVAPNPVAQEAVLRRAYRDAGVAPSDVDYVEAHGTGTPLGDPIEAGAIAAVCAGGDRADGDPVLLGSVKGTTGHLEAAAGVAGLIRAVQVLRHRLVPPTSGVDAPNPLIPFATNGLRLVTSTPVPLRRRPRAAVAGVSAFGFGGTNAHVVIEAAETAETAAETAEPVCVLSGRDGELVRGHASALADWVEARPGTDPAAVAATLARRGPSGPVRAGVPARDAGELVAGLRAVASGAGIVTAPMTDAVWVFSGYGTHWSGMGRDLLAHEPAFAREVAVLDPLLRGAAGTTLSQGLREGGPWTGATAQVLTFGMQVALAAAWRSCGLTPAAVLGHSMGEVAAAVVAQALPLADAVRLMTLRAGLLGELGPGAMAVVELDECELDDPAVTVAVVAAPRQLVVSGPLETVTRLVERVAAQGRLARVVTTEGAGHSAAVDPLVPRLVGALADLRPQPPAVPWYSTVSGHLDERTPVLDAAYWGDNLRRQVRLADAVAAATIDGHRCFLEISPHPVLAGPITAGRPDSVVLASARRGAELATMRRSVTAFQAGRLLPLPPPGRGELLDLPPVPWRHRRHWFEPAPVPAGPLPGAPAPAPAPAPGAAEPLTADVIRERLADRIAAVLGERPAPDVRLIDLGLDSLSALRIRGLVEADLGVRIPAATLLRGATLAELAADIAGTAPSTMDPLIRPLRTDGDHPPVLLPHPAGADSGVYRQLVGLLGPGQPGYGLDRFADGGTVVERAAGYVRLIRRHWPGGPYRLVGWSLGGVLAYETACQLTAAGHRVDLVGLIDALVPEPVDPERDAALRTARYTGFAEYLRGTYGIPVRLTAGDLAGLTDDEQVALLRQRIEATGLADRIPPAALRHQLTTRADAHVLERYVPGPYAGPVTLYTATRPAPWAVPDERIAGIDAVARWRRVCPDLRVVELAGHHFELLDPPLVRVVADDLRTLLTAGD